MLVQKERAQAVINRCKKMNKKIVAGGPAFTTSYEKFINVDVVISGEAENIIPVFIEDLKKGNEKKFYSSDIKPDISKAPIPLWDLIKFKNYATMAVQFSRGCPFNCEFCDIIIMNGRVPRTKSPEQMIAELNALYKAGWKGSIFIVDDNFIGNKEKVKEMLEFLIVWQKEHNYPFRFLTEASVNLADDEELMDKMIEANFNKIFVGLETTSLASLKECNKVQNLSCIPEESIKKFHSKGFEVMGGFIVGFDNDTPTIFKEQINFIQKTGVVTAMVGLLNALPKTKLYERLKNENRLLKDTTGNNTEISLNFKPKMNQDILVTGYKTIIKTLYSVKSYYNRILTFIKSYNPKTKGKVSLRDFFAFFRSIWRIGIFSKARFHYWRLILKTTFTKIKALPVAVEMAINGVHFEKISKNIINSF